jgi:WD40 repeat protein
MPGLPVLVEGESPMRRYWLLLAALGVALPNPFAKPVPTQARAGDAKQPDTDPLPPGAFARLGTERLRHSNEVNGLAFSPDGKMLLSTGSGQDVRLWDTATGKEVRRLRAPVRAMALSPDGAFVAASCDEGGKCTFRLWETATGKPHPWPAKHVGWVNALAFSPDSKTLATAEQDRVIRLWDVGTGKLVGRLQGKQLGVLSVAFSPDGKWLLSGAKDRTICLWKVATGEVAHFLRTKSPISAVAFSPDGNTFASAGGDGVVLWETATGERLRQFAGHRGPVYCVAFAPQCLF